MRVHGFLEMAKVLLPVLLAVRLGGPTWLALSFIRLPVQNVVVPPLALRATSVACGAVAQPKPWSKKVAPLPLAMQAALAVASTPGVLRLSV